MHILSTRYIKVIPVLVLAMIFALGMALPVLADAPVAGFGNSLDFDGTNEFVEVPYASALNPDQFTVEAWVNTRQSANFSAPFSSRDSSVFTNLRGWNVYNTDAGKWQFWMGTGGNTWEMFTGPDVETNTWFHIAYSFNGTTGRFYVDGVEQATASVPGYSKTRPVPSALAPPIIMSVPILQIGSLTAW